MSVQTCPQCAADLRGEPIPEEYRQAGYYGPPETAPTHYERVIGVEVRGVYDGVLFWQCPDCGANWHRWPEGHPRRRTAEKYVDSAVAK